MKQTEDVFRADGTLEQVKTPIPPGYAMRFTYEYTHLPTGQVFRDTRLFRNQDAFNQCLKRWNLQGTGVWEYRAITEETAHARD